MSGRNELPDWADGVTVLRSNFRRMAKLVQPDGTTDSYDSAKHFDGFTIRVAGVLGLMALQRKLLPRPNCVVVRGALIDGPTATNIRRLAYEDPETGDKPTLQDVPRRWLLLDVDNIARPDNVTPANLLACADAAIEHLPREFHRATCTVQATASHGIRPGIRLRLGYWCDRPMWGAELKRWLAGCPLDFTVFNPAQPIYTAAPVFAPGLADHLPVRLVEYPGEDWLRCPPAAELAPPPRPAPAPPEKLADGTQAQKYGRAALIRAADAVATAPEGNRHATLVGEARSLARLIKAGIVTEADMRAVLSRAAAHAGKSDTAEISACLTWALAHPSDSKLPEARDAA